METTNKPFSVLIIKNDMEKFTQQLQEFHLGFYTIFKPVFFHFYHIGTEDSTKTAPKGRNSAIITVQYQRLLNACRE